MLLLITIINLTGKRRRGRRGGVCVCVGRGEGVTDYHCYYCMYLVEISNQRLPGGNRRGTIESEVRVAFGGNKQFQDV